MELTSTHTHDKSKAVLIKSYPVADIISRYKRELNMDVASFFKGIENIQLFECKFTGYQYYRPHGLYGDGPFYEARSILIGIICHGNGNMSRLKKCLKKRTTF
ncbi:hypothetical protein N7U66_19130 [Lacinutrix neustonica]|uniref:Uncharacterized protein n=1 Tax=Lacinutrix neustonica TaxID=2980107 RepID=A0A9E8MV38_9FLAO|nr:hypothetical protein [Lacinutrix neustonica]WAC01931.1 hypothetical protein N7U66_19130 [Lacinutrix neustonica]